METSTATPPPRAPPTNEAAIAELHAALDRLSDHGLLAILQSDPHPTCARASDLIQSTRREQSAFLTAYLGRFLLIALLALILAAIVAITAQGMRLPQDWAVLFVI